MQPNPSPYPLPPTTIVIEAKKPPVGPMIVSPRARINGHVIPLAWGRNEIPAPAGVHQVQIFVPWLWDQGKAEITVDNSYGPAPVIHYAMPFTAFHKGAIGHQPMKNPGLLAFVLMFAVPLAVVVLCCGGSVLLDSAGSSY
jgi:hypothetical protein